MEYTKEWIKLVDRGKLFKINDESFHFFCELEKKVSACIHNVLSSGGQAQSEKADVISNIVEDVDIQFSWLLLCLDLDDEQ